VKAALVGLGLAMAGIGWAFRAAWATFWVRMTLVTGGLGWYAMLVRPELRRLRPTFGDVVSAVLSALGLYGIFQLGDRAARRVMPRGTAEIERVYQLRRSAPDWLIALLLVGIIAPGEELFWRGLVQDTFARRWGRVRGAAAATACYGAAHLSSGNLTLVAAAATAGAHWGLQYAGQRRLPSTIVSHMLWDVWIFLISPMSEAGREP